MALKTNHNHQHNHCRHPEVKYCVDCQRPYCTKCGKEWFSTSYSYPYSITTSASSGNFCGTLTSANTMGSNSSHAHTEVLDNEPEPIL